jgi:putative drug exporter of the RND superfamily
MFFYNLGKFVYRRKWLVIGIWALVLVAALPFVPRVMEPLKTGGFADPTLESSQAADVLQKELGYSPSTVVVFYQSKDGNLSVYDEKFATEVQQSLSGLEKLPYKPNIVLPNTNPQQIGRDGKTAYAVITLPFEPETATKRLPQVRELLVEPPSLKMTIGGGLAFFEDVELVSQRDLIRAEVIAFPVAIIALVLAFGSIVAGTLPVVVGGVGVLIILASLFAVGNVTDISIFAVNLATLLGLGLGLDYSLFLASRFREELARGRSIEEAIAITSATAGKAVTYSGLTVLIGLSGTFLFKINLIVSVGIAGFVVVIVSVLAAITLLPAILSLIGQKVNALSVSGLMARWRKTPVENQPRNEEHGFWAWLSHIVMRYPFRFFVPTLIFLVLLGLPFIHVRFSAPDASILPPDVSSRQAQDILRANFNQSDIAPVIMAVRTKPGDNVLSVANISYLYDFVQEVQKDPRVARVDSLVSVEPRFGKAQYQTIYADISRVQDVFFAQYVRAYASDDTTLVSVISKFPPNSPETQALVEKLRNSQIGNGMTFQITGQTAGIMDIVDSIYGTFPIAALFIIVVTYIVLLILLRSVVLPVKAILMNALSLLASYGMLVWVFQDGNLSGLLNFQPLGLIEPSLPIIMFCTLFGLSMDYEVFLLSRIKEYYDQTGDNTRSVALGLQKSGKIITSAALIVVVVCISFVTADIVLVKALGLGVAVAVGLDATIVRALLVPSTMRLLGHWNWYAPAWLLRILPDAQLEKEDFTPTPTEPPKEPVAR